MIQMHSTNTNTQATPDAIDIPVESNTSSPTQTDTTAIIDTAVRT